MDSLVSTQWLADHLDDPAVTVVEIDWDGLEAYQQGHIPGALGWHWKQALWDPFERQFPDQQLFAARLSTAGITPATTVVIYGVPVQFGTYAWWVFRYCGHQDVRMLDGGITRWQADGRPLSTVLPGTTPASYVPGSVTPGRRAGRKDVLQAIDDPEVVILDHRSAEEYAGERVGLPGKPDVGAERAGRIPGAKHVPFDSLLNDDDTFKSKEELADILLPQVGNRHRPVISYCRLAHRATLAYFAMSELLGFTNVRVYDGSWTEWGSLVGVPIER